MELALTLRIFQNCKLIRLNSSSTLKPIDISVFEPDLCSNETEENPSQDFFTTAADLISAQPLTTNSGTLKTNQLIRHKVKLEVKTRINYSPITFYDWRYQNSTIPFIRIIFYLLKASRIHSSKFFSLMLKSNVKKLKLKIFQLVQNYLSILFVFKVALTHQAARILATTFASLQTTDVQRPWLAKSA